jgi:hypothetical protein
MVLVNNSLDRHTVPFFTTAYTCFKSLLHTAINPCFLLEDKPQPILPDLL